MQTLDELGYDVADAERRVALFEIIDGKHFLPQHRETIVLVGFRRDLNLKAHFTLRDISECFPAHSGSDAGEAVGPDGRGEIGPHAGAVEVPLSICEKTSGAR
ncbi:hypothetical protein ACLB1O_06585 [Escherichia coli]